MDDIKLKNVFEHPDGVIPIFKSLEAFRDYMFAMREQVQKKPTTGVDKESSEHSVYINIKTQ